MGIFRKSKPTSDAVQHKAIIHDAEDVQRIQQQTEYILENKMSNEDASVAGSVPSAKSNEKKGFFKSQTKRRPKKKKRYHNFQRLSTGCSTPINAYEPPEGSLFFSEDSDPPVTQEDVMEGSTTYTDSSTLGGGRESTSSREEENLETEGLTSRVQTKPKYKVPKNSTTAAVGTLKEPVVKASPTPKGFQKLKDDESVGLSPLPAQKGFLKLGRDEESNSTKPKGLYRNQHEASMMSAATVKENSSVVDYEPPDFDLLMPVSRPYSDLTASASGSSTPTSYNTTIQVTESNSSTLPLSVNESVFYSSAETLSNKDSASSGQGGSFGPSSSSSSSESSQSSSKEGGSEKFSDRGSVEFRQFVFDKQFSRIHAVSVERSDSGVPNEMFNAAARLTSNLQAGLAHKYSPSPVRKPTKEANYIDTKDARLSLASDASRFPSPKFPTPKAMPKQQLLAPPSNSEKAKGSARTQRYSNKVSENCNELMENTRKEDNTLSDTMTAPPKDIVTSCEFTVVSNMSATVETTERAMKSSMPRTSTTTNLEGKEQDDSFHAEVLSEVDDRLWETDSHPFEVANKSDMKFQGSQIKKSSSADDALIASIRKATQRKVAERKPDPSPRALQKSQSDTGLPQKSTPKGKKKTVLREVRERSPKKRTPLRKKEDPPKKDQQSNFPVKTITGSCANVVGLRKKEDPPKKDQQCNTPEKIIVDSHVNVVGLPKSPGYQNKPLRMSLDSVIGNPLRSYPEESDTPSSRVSVSEKVKEIEKKQRFSRERSSTPTSLSRKKTEDVEDEENNLKDAFSPQQKLGIAKMSRTENSFSSPGRNRPGLPFSPSSAQNRMVGSPFSPNQVRSTRNVVKYAQVLSSAFPAAAIGPDSEELEDPVDSLFEGPRTKLSHGSFIRGAKGRVESPAPDRWQLVGSTAASNLSKQPGVPNNAIMASMLFQAGNSESEKALCTREEAEDEYDDELPRVPPAVQMSDSIDAVSSITEEASSFYHKSFQLWSKTAHNALNNFQKGSLARNPNHYRSEV